MKNPCQACERSLLDKNECSLGCERRHEYCVYLGISVTGMIPPLEHKKPRSCSSVVAEHSPYKGKVAGSMPARATNLPKTCPNHPGRPTLKYYRECLECVNERTAKSARAREEKRQAKEQTKALKPPYDWHAPRPMRSKAGRLGHATVCIKNGKGNRETHRLTGMHTHTVAKLRKVLEEQNGGPFLCACGRPAVHKGRCDGRDW